MNPPVFTALNADTAAKALLGSNPLRVYPWGQAPEDVAKPYVTYGVYSGVPENNLDCPPSIDNLGTQIEIWGKTGQSVIACFNAIRYALEPLGHMTGFQSATKDAETELFTARMEFDFWTDS